MMSKGLEVKVREDGRNCNWDWQQKRWLAHQRQTVKAGEDTAIASKAQQALLLQAQ